MSILFLRLVFEQLVFSRCILWKIYLKFFVVQHDLEDKNLNRESKEFKGISNNELLVEETLKSGVKKKFELFDFNLDHVFIFLRFIEICYLENELEN